MSGTNALLGICVVFLIFAIFWFLMNSGFYEAVANTLGSSNAFFISLALVLGIVGGILKKLS